jgi:hypothetical protein
LSAASAALAVAHERIWPFCVIGLLTGAAYGLAFAALGNLVVDAVEPEHTGAASGVNTIARTVGGAFGRPTGQGHPGGVAGRVRPHHSLRRLRGPRPRGGGHRADRACQCDRLRWPA